MWRERRTGALVLVLLCGLAIVAGALLTWINGRGRRPASGITHTSITGLFHWSYQATASFLHSFALAVVVCGALVVIGALVASRLVAGLFSLLALAAAGLWIALNAKHYQATNLPFSNLRIGAWLVIGGGLIGFIASFAMRRSRLP